MKAVLLFILFLVFPVFAETSTCFGTTSNGRLVNSVKLPWKGKNFISYSTLAATLGRTYVHSEVRGIVVSSYAELEKSYPNKVFKYAETGFKNGGAFKPHKTHQNGLSIDFMVPVVNAKGESVHLPTNALNRLGYDIEFDDSSIYNGLTIDYEAMAAHIASLHRASVKNGYELWRVIFDPKLQPNLFKTSSGAYLKNHVQFSKKRSWVRHDEHYRTIIMDSHR